MEIKCVLKIKNLRFNLEDTHLTAPKRIKN